MQLQQVGPVDEAELDEERSQPLLDAAAVARRLATTERHVRRLVAERRIPFVRVGRFVRFNPTAIAEWVETNTTDPA